MQNMTDNELLTLFKNMVNSYFQKEVEDLIGRNLSEEETAFNALKNHSKIMFNIFYSDFLEENNLTTNEEVN